MGRLTKILLGLVLLFQSINSFAADVDVVLSNQSRNRAAQSELMSSSFQSHLDEVSNSVRVKNNQSLLLINGLMSYPARYALIKKAKRSIILSTFSIYSHRDSSGGVVDSYSRKMVDLLVQKKKAGVKVLVIYDGATSVLAQSQAAVDILRANGIKVVKYNPVVGQDSELSLGLSLLPGAVRLLTNQNPINNRWHEKTLIVDGTYLLSGGLNWGELYATGNAFSTYQYSPSGFYNQPLIKELGVKAEKSWAPTQPDSWRDTDILVKGPVVTEAVRRLLFDFALIDLLGEKGRSGYKYKNASIEDLSEAYQRYMELYGDKENIFFNPNYLKNERANQVFSGSSMGTFRYMYQRPYMDRRLDSRNEQIANYAKNNGLNYNEDNPSTYITNYYLNVINKAKKQILWGCHSNRPTPEMLKALGDAAQRGVKIYIMGNSRASAKTLPDKGQLMYPSAYCHYRPLLRAGKGNIRIFEWQRELSINGVKRKSGAFHSKVFSVDGVLTSVGSYNLSKASFKKHTEGTIVVADKDFSKEAERMFSKDIRFTKEVKLIDLKDDTQGNCSNY